VLWLVDQEHGWFYLDLQVHAVPAHLMDKWFDHNRPDPLLLDP
jgi:hypothetical protein